MIKFINVATDAHNTNIYLAWSLHYFYWFWHGGYKVSN